jgi:glycosyltransferase involved in cell wall biosynthesis
MKRVLVLASTFPASDGDPVPAFVKDQVVALSRTHPELEFHVLAPHDRRSATADVTHHEHYTEHRFHYAWPRRLEQLAGRGIMPALRASPVLYLVVPALFFAEFRATRRLVRELEPSLVYAHWFTPQAIVAGWVSASHAVPFSYTTHASDVSVWSRIPWIGPRIVRSTTRRASAISAVSSRTKAKLVAFIGDSEGRRVRIIPMGVHTMPRELSEGDRRAARVRLVLGDERVCLFIGRLVEKKGVEYLLEAVAHASSSWTLLIAGDGPLRAELETRVAELGLGERVRFLGFVAAAEKADAFAAADALVVPSVVSADGDAEGLPVALLEGLAAGLPCIATRESGADDILDDRENGFLCASRDPAAITHLLDEIAGMPSAQLSRMKAAARELAVSFAWPGVAEQHYQHLFREVLEVGADG